MALLGRPGRRLLTLAFVIGAFASVAPTRAAAAASAPATQAPAAYILVDADTGCVAAAKDEHRSLLAASTVKLLTALAALERLPLDATVPVSARAASQPAMKINMHAGEVWPLDAAMHSLLMVSANDAAYAVAERTSGSIEQFAKDADATAKRLGAQETAFSDPAGLDGTGSYAGGTRMSAYDLAVVARNALAVPEIANTSKLLDYRFTDPTGTGRHLRNHNSGFLTSYAGATGLKTGLTKAAGRTLVTSATRNGRTMIAVVMGTWDDTGWAGYLSDVGFGTPAAKPCPAAKLPPVRAVTASTRLHALDGLPSALGVGRAGGVGSKTGATASGTATTRPKPRGTGHNSPARDSGATNVAATPLSSTTAAGSQGLLGTIFTVRNLLFVVFVLAVALFLLRRRAVRRQRARRIARHKRMAEVRRRRMIDVVDPAAVEADELSHVKVVPARTRSTAL